MPRRLPPRRPNDSRDRATIRALTELNPELADFFVRGRMLCRESDRPAQAYFIAHSGRELINGILRVLVPSMNQRDPADDNREKLPRHIAAALGLLPRHPTVRSLAKLHRAFQGSAHVRNPGTPTPDSAQLRRAFSQLADLLYGLVGDYFQTQAEIDAFADTADPTTVNLDQLQIFLLRPVQRRRFFMRLNNPEWLAPLSTAGLFSHPPLRLTHDDGSWQPREWPEGAYLVRVASLAPEQVTRLLSAIPDDNDNPAVWHQLTEAVEALPPAVGATLARKICNALGVGIPHQFGFRALEAAVALAQAGRNEAFLVANALLSIGNAPIPAPTNVSNADYLEQLRDRRRQVSHGDAWVLPNIEPYTLDQMVERLFPLLDHIDAARTVRMLLDRVERASRLVASTAQFLNKAIATLDADAPVNPDPFDLDEPEIDSRHWCPSLVHQDITRSTRALLAREAFRRRPAYDELQPPRRDNEIFRRMLLARLAEEQQLAPELQPLLDQFVASEDAIDPDFTAVESSALLRAHFTSASPEAQQSFLAALELGPGDGYLTTLLHFREEEDTPASRAELIEDWQRLRLRWFHDRIPPLLQPLATRLGVQHAVPSARNQSLDETGTWFSGTSSAAARSPVTAADLATLQSDDFVRYLISWRPPADAYDPFESPSLEGLEIAVRSLAAQTPAIISAALPAITSNAVPLHYLTAIAGGLASAIQQQHRVSLPLITAIAEHVWQQAFRAPHETKRDAQVARWAADAVIRMLRAYGERVPLSTRSRATLWRISARFADSPLVWRDEPGDQPPTTFTAAINRSSGSLSGNLLELIFEVAFKDFLVAHARTTWPPPAATATAARLIPIVESVLARTGQAAADARGTIGRHVPQLLWIGRTWTTTHLDDLFEHGFDDPGTQPAWAAFVESAQLRPPLFEIVRHWFARFASWLPDDGSAPEQDPDWSLAERLALHVTWAVIAGRCAPGDADRIVENTFDRIPVKDRAHAYWSIMSGFSKDKRVAASLTRNVVKLWSSRLDALEALPVSDTRDEEVDALTQLIGVRHLPVHDSIRLGQRTTALLRKKQRVTSMAWDRLEDLARSDAAGTLVIVDRMVNCILAGDYPYISFDDAAPALRAAIAKGGRTRDKALSVIHRLGAAGFTEFAELYREAQGNA